jgi:epoxyqueuosine reductase QueG
VGALDGRGLNVCLPLDAAAFDAACAPVAPSLRLETLLPGARGALVVGSAGRAFFEAFARARAAGDAANGTRSVADAAPDPLDRYTRAVVEETVRDALAPLGIEHALRFPFVGEARGGSPIPFQRLGRAAGLGAPGPLGLQIHPVYGPWWAYRALVVVDAELATAAPVGDGCAGCDAPCVAACPAAAVQRAGFVVPACHARRLVAEACHLSCAARIACVRGPEHRYADEQLAFHMAASMPRRPPSGTR